MKRHKMTIDLALTMPDGHSVKKARKQVQDFLNRAGMGVGVISIVKITSPRPWEAKPRTGSVPHEPCVITERKTK